MDCIHWAAMQMTNPLRSTGVETATTSAGELNDEEMEELFQFNLNEDRLVDPPASQQTSQDVSSETETDELEREESKREESDRVNEEEVSSSYVDIWEKDLEMISKLREKEPPHSLKRRQLELIGASVKQSKEDCRNREEVRMAQFLEETKARWIAVGMLKEEDAHLLQTVDGPYHLVREHMS